MIGLYPAASPWYFTISACQQGHQRGEGEELRTPRVVGMTTTPEAMGFGAGSGFNTCIADTVQA